MEVTTARSKKEKDLLPQKRRKITKKVVSNIQSTQPAAMLVSESTPGDKEDQTDLFLPIGILPPELYHLQSKYEFTSMSIISSSKIELKVRNLQRRLEKFSFADIKAKPQVVALHANAPVVSKMVTVIQIVKKNIEKEKGKWWQYSKLQGQIMELEETPKKGNGGDKTLREWQRVQAAAGGLVSATANVEDEGVEAGDGDPAFEMMDSKDQGIETRKKVRAVPVMTIYMSMVPVKEFKDLYGSV